MPGVDFPFESGILGAFWGPFHTSFPCRHYPPRFGQKFLRLFPKFIKSCTPLEEALPQVADQDVYAGMSFKDMWEDADMESVIRYLKGNRCLLIPAEYRNVLLQSDHD